MKRLMSIVLAASCVAAYGVSAIASELPRQNLIVRSGEFTPSMVSVLTPPPPSQFTIISWNVDSEGADPHVVAARIFGMKDVDLWGLCNVRDEHWARLFEQAADGTEPGRFARILSPTGGSDRSCVLYDKTKFECLGYFEFSWAGQPWYRIELNLRPGLVAHLRHRSSKQELYFMVNWLRGASADNQATALNAWASRQNAPVIAVGTYDFEYHPEAQPAAQPDHRGYPVLTSGGVFQWLIPDNPVRTVWRGDIDAMDDFVLLADSRHRLTGQCHIIVEPDDFPDTDLTPDHRPLWSMITIRPGQ